MDINQKCIGVQTETEIVKEEERNRDRERQKERKRERKSELAEKRIAKGQKTVIKTKTKNS